MAEFEFKAERRERAGKGAARALRRAGRVPAVIYGDKKDPVSISLPYKETELQIQKGGFLSHILTIDVDGEKTRVIPRDYQLDVVRDFPMHVDFLRVSKSTKITVGVHVNFINEETSPGLKRGGALNIVRREVEVECPALEIPESITVDLAEADIGDSIHVSAVKLPAGVNPTITDRDFTIATIAAPAGYNDDADEGESEGEEESAE
ncbi:50S ribosomal protein L25/general stress protein Ctc [Cohaesibacter gelatinilyticus]|uniref:Large ribosomal subunit protein bL25 n=1 Tax=Cohaesibacter gelatinilyticus TaxID=372072 RepID=A0A285PGM8_9HYPH|nr:50S ribosomal protein L25/general stress protein Ctc [Cohaesibacter gelatinilyticus]SNZ20880.1 LSU ribosomal protein L25P [Cohaesibacter gelatinilyticus]